MRFVQGVSAGIFLTILACNIWRHFQNFDLVFALLATFTIMGILLCAPSEDEELY